MSLPPRSPVALYAPKVTSSYIIRTQIQADCLVSMRCLLLVSLYPDHESGQIVILLPLLAGGNENTMTSLIARYIGECESTE
jgi:hypothetical protein